MQVHPVPSLLRHAPSWSMPRPSTHWSVKKRQAWPREQTAAVHLGGRGWRHTGETGHECARTVHRSLTDQREAVLDLYIRTHRTGSNTRRPHPHSHTCLSRRLSHTSDQSLCRSRAQCPPPQCYPMHNHPCAHSVTLTVHCVLCPTSCHTNFGKSHCCTTDDESVLSRSG